MAARIHVLKRILSPTVRGGVCSSFSSGNKLRAVRNGSVYQNTVFEKSIGARQFSASPVCSASFTRSVKSTKVEVNGVKINYDHIGTGEHYVVLMPGALGGSINFVDQLNGMSIDKYTLISFDPRGYGHSRPPERDWPLLFLHRDADDATGLMKALGIKKYSVLGWSDGGISAMILAAENPNCVRRLVLWGANAYITENDMKIFDGFRDLSTWSDRMRQPFEDLYGREYFQKHWALWVDAYQNYYKQRDGDICKDLVPKIECQTLLVNGHKDAMVMQEHPMYLNKHIPNCKMIDWPNGKHNLHMRYAKEFNELVEEFLDEDKS